MTNSETFKAAHRQVRNSKLNIGTYAQRFATALKSLYLRARLVKQRIANKIKNEAIAAKKQALQVAERKANRKPTQPTSCYFGAWSWEAAMITAV